jgi:hypothetical protein
MTFDVKVSTRGPVPNGTAHAIVAAYREDALDEIAQQGYADVMANLNTSIRRPTPYYETQVTWQRVAPDRLVHDRGVIYGPWLEGTGSRNRTTRFKGYASFRRAAQTLEAKAGALANHVFRTRWLEKLR